MPKITFVIGANGVGKSSVLSEISSLLPTEKFELHDFDERGVPDNADKVWRASETQHWISIGEENATKGISTIIFGFVKPQEVEGHTDIILLDADNETLEERIRSRYLTPESLAELERTTGKDLGKFISDNIYASSLLREECARLNCTMILTDGNTPREIAEKIKNII